MSSIGRERTHGHSSGISTATTLRHAAIGADDQSRQARLVESLAQTAPVGSKLRRLETHISYVLLDGRHAYKIKKAVALGFLDFTRLADRRRYCEKELELNRRSAPGIYLDVVPITGTIEHPVIGGSGEAIEWALRMREFPQDALLCDVLERGALANAQVDALAGQVAEFHRHAPSQPPDPWFGSPDDVLDLALGNLAALRSVLPEPEDQADLNALETWTRSEHAALRERLALRREAGFIRECHGDLHLGNIALVDDAIVLFDCIEFSERLRWIDVICEIAFTVMDFESRGRQQFARRFLNAYLEATGDYRGIALLRFYVVYRSLVRAKVAALRAGQAEHSGEATAALEDCRAHMTLAKTFARHVRAALIITHGYSGCGKTTLTQAVVDRLGAVRIRTDVERKRMHGVAARARTGSGIASGIYAEEVTRGVYDHVRTLARAVLEAGFVTIVDGAFLRRWQREPFRRLAGELDVPLVIVAFDTPEATLRDRILRRARTGSDASEATLEVLAAQRAAAEAFDAEEYAFVLTCNSDRSFDTATADLIGSLELRLGLVS